MRNTCSCAGLGCRKKRRLLCNEEDTEVKRPSGTKVSPRPAGVLVQEKVENRIMKERQMMPSVNSVSGAPSADQRYWANLNWSRVETSVNRLQFRIAQATQQGRYGKVKALQWLLTHSLQAKQLAIKRVTSNPGARTPGVDNVIWRTDQQKMYAVQTLNRKGYHPQPLRRIYIPKKNGKQRPLGIPTFKDRAMQALHLLALEPVVEVQADGHTYGFRPKRSCADAIEQCFNILCRKTSSHWVLEGDIQSCFDRIDHRWMKTNTLMDTVVLGKWLASGYMEKGTLYRTEEGTPQGGIISPRLATHVLNGLEAAAKAGLPKSAKVNVVVYADDFVITGATKELLEEHVKPRVKAFLKPRGLELSERKTKITHIRDGFDFLGFSIKKYANGKLLIKPSKQQVAVFLRNMRYLIKRHPTATTEGLIRLLNPRIRGWANYYRQGVAKDTFSYIDHHIFLALQRWIRRKHPNKSRAWCKEKYYRHTSTRDWVFGTRIKDVEGKSQTLDLFHANTVRITRHVKIRSQAHPFAPLFVEYFKQRGQRKGNQRSFCPDSEVAGSFNKGL